MCILSTNVARKSTDSVIEGRWLGMEMRLSLPSPLAWLPPSDAGSGIFKSNNPQKRAHAMVQAVTHFKDPKILAQISEDLGAPMVRLHWTKIQLSKTNSNFSFEPGWDQL